mgnify:CR=1 FL=1
MGLLVILLINAFVTQFINSHNHKKEHEMELSNKNQVAYKVTGMSCNHCKMSVEKAIAGIDGVESVTVDLPSGMAYVSGAHDANKLIDAVKALGFECEAA